MKERARQRERKKRKAKKMTLNKYKKTTPYKAVDRRSMTPETESYEYYHSHNAYNPYASPVQTYW